jgi:hypothetical protein
MDFSYTLGIFLYFHFFREQKYPSTITNWILSSSFELERILIRESHMLFW